MIVMGGLLDVPLARILGYADVDGAHAGVIGPAARPLDTQVVTNYKNRHKSHRHEPQP
jgi:hypothetical protein